MPSSQVQAFTLTPHPTVEEHAVLTIGGELSRTSDRLLVGYVLKGNMERVFIPEPKTPRFADELWRHTCFEIFIAPEGAPHYHEFNFSPSGEWAAYAFARYRERVQLNVAVDITAIDPQVIVRRSAGKLELDATVHLHRISPRYASAKLLIGLSAVVESHGNMHDSLSYWALKHPPGKPDFHHRGAFVLELDEIRN